ncbi:hypothetical protein C4K01_1983 [Pseudomonas synxantha]|nr:hypothetical protein C4K01_1983 [Pseudomonas synxantha]
MRARLTAEYPLDAALRSFTGLEPSKLRKQQSQVARHS